MSHLCWGRLSPFTCLCSHPRKTSQGALQMAESISEGWQVLLRAIFPRGTGWGCLRAGHPSPTSVPGGNHPCTVPHLLSPRARVPPLHPGTPPHTHSRCPQSRRELGTFGYSGTGGPHSYIPYVLLAIVRQILHFSTSLREPVLPWYSSPRVPSSCQHPHGFWDAVLQWLQMQLTAPQSSFLREKENSD